MQLLSLFQATLGWAWINYPACIWPGCFSLEWVGLGLFLGSLRSGVGLVSHLVGEGSFLLPFFF
jgi:hypothetical protein